MGAEGTRWVELLGVGWRERRERLLPRWNLGALSPIRKIGSFRVAQWMPAKSTLVDNNTASEQSLRV